MTLSHLLRAEARGTCLTSLTPHSSSITKTCRHRFEKLPQIQHFSLCTLTSLIQTVTDFRLSLASLPLRPSTMSSVQQPKALYRSGQTILCCDNKKPQCLSGFRQRLTNSFSVKGQINILAFAGHTLHLLSSAVISTRFVALRVTALAH